MDVIYIENMNVHVMECFFIILLSLLRISTSGVLVHVDKRVKQEDADKECSSINGTLARINIMEKTDLTSLKTCLHGDTAVWIEPVDGFSPWLVIIGCLEITQLNSSYRHFGKPSVSVCCDMCKNHGNVFGVKENIDYMKAETYITSHYLRLCMKVTCQGSHINRPAKLSINCVQLVPTRMRQIFCFKCRSPSKHLLQGNDCFCGLKEDILTSKTDQLCSNNPCEGVFCGGSNSITVYKKDSDDPYDTQSSCMVQKCLGTVTDSNPINRRSCNESHPPACYSKTPQMNRSMSWWKAMTFCLRTSNRFLKMDCTGSNTHRYHWIGVFRIKQVPDGVSSVSSLRRNVDKVNIESDTTIISSNKSCLCYIEKHTSAHWKNENHYHICDMSLKKFETGINHNGGFPDENDDFDFDDFDRDTENNTGSNHNTAFLIIIAGGGGVLLVLVLVCAGLKLKRLYC